MFKIKQILIFFVLFPVILSLGLIAIAIKFNANISYLSTLPFSLLGSLIGTIILWVVANLALNRKSDPTGYVGVAYILLGIGCGINLGMILGTIFGIMKQWL